MSTLKEVAKRAGVSIATVSYCVNNTKKVKNETRDRIMQAIKDLNYIPNAAARNLKSISTKEIGVIFPDIDDICHSEILKGIISNTEAAGYMLNIAFSYNKPKLEGKLIDAFISRNVSGLILITCQPSNSAFFRDSLIRHNVPSVFIERFPENIDANFLSFDNYNSCYYVTKKLLDAGYHQIMIMTGNNEYFCEYECIRGFCDAYDDSDIPFSSSQAIESALTKEDAFRRTMLHIINNPPEAIIVSSELLTKGIMEAFNLCGIKVPGQTCVITLGEDCWNETNYLNNVIHTSRAAYTLGQHSFDILIKNLKAPEFFEKEFMLFKDNVLESHLHVPPVPKTSSGISTPSKTLKILAPSLQTILSMQAVSHEFEMHHNVKIDWDIVSYRKLFESIDNEASKGNEQYDIYFFDVSWLRYFAEKQAFVDISSFIDKNEVFRTRLIKKNLENCCCNGRYYGFPIVGGTHILFYRRDLFEDPLIQGQFESQYKLALRPPRTWKEFNVIAKFFTKEYNAYSPTIYGTSVIGSINEEFTLELLIRLWSFGEGLYDNSGHLKLDTPQNIKGFQSMLESCRYTNNIFDTSIDQSFRAFGTGHTAMLLSFTEYASQINDCVKEDVISNVDYCMLPGRTPANVGWNMGLSKHTKHTELIEEYYKWLCDKRISYYMTTLNGQSVVTYPYQNHEIMKLYPWMQLTAEGQSKAHNRIYPYSGKKGLIPPYRVETVLYDTFKRIYNNEMSVSDSLHMGQKELMKLIN